MSKLPPTNLNLKSYFLADIACRTGIIFRRFSGERRQARSERGAPDTRDRRRPACLVSVCLALVVRFAFAFALAYSDYLIIGN